ncbi:MAG: SLC13/DASS family transporter [Deltaproteobacteria bacterium]|nr:SLC13/DASS family transporter [Deltaproteobacteria bacterium]
MSLQSPSLTRKRDINWSRLLFILAGLVLFGLFYGSPSWPDAVDPMGKHFPLTPEARGALGLFLLAVIWWVFEVIPIGVTSLALGVFQVLFLIRPAAEAFRDFTHPAVMFILASTIIGTVLTKTGIPRRLAYRTLAIAGERTGMIYLGCFMITVLLTHIMAQTAVAATIYPFLVAIYSSYGGAKNNNFGKGLYIGMAYMAGAGSIITLLGAARGAVAVGFFHEVVGKDIDFFHFSYYLFPIGWLMMFLLWALLMVVFKPEKSSIPGLKKRAQEVIRELGPLSHKEKQASYIIAGVILLLLLQTVVPPLRQLDKSAIILISSLLFFLTGILDINDLEEIPWNIILLFSGAMSLGLCLWGTGAAKWLAVQLVFLCNSSGWYVFIMILALVVMALINLIVNVAVMAITIPVALFMAPYLGLSSEVILFVTVVAAGMPFMSLSGAAPNAIAYNSRQFTTKEFFRTGLLASGILLAVIALAVTVIWPFMGMPVIVPR